jgi:hypothetical protein
MQLMERELVSKTDIQMKTCPSSIMFTTNPTEADQESNLGHHGGKMMTNCLSYGVAIHSKPLSQPNYHWGKKNESSVSPASEMASMLLPRWAETSYINTDNN